MPEKGSQKTVITAKLGGRDPGNETLQCLSCGRVWGADDVIPIEKIIKESPDAEILGMKIRGFCPQCGSVPVLEIHDAAKIIGGKEDESDGETKATEDHS